MPALVDLPADPVGADLEPGVVDERAISLRLPKYDPGRFVMLVKDRDTGKLREVNLGPFSLESILRSSRRDRPMIGSLIVEAIVTELQTLAPDFMPAERRRLDEPKLTVVLDHEMPARPKGWLPAWRRRRSDNGQGQP